jgi:SAM-dependent methyltransferase
VSEVYYRPDLALVHHLGFGFHADGCAPALVELLAPVRARDGLVLEIGCGSGLLTRHLVAAGCRVLATDASPAMLELARATAPEAEAITSLVLPDDPVPEVDAIVGVGHVLNYLPSVAHVERALRALARALRPRGVLAIDLEDLEWAARRIDQPEQARLGDDWAVISRSQVPAPDRFVRSITSFVRIEDDVWRRDDEVHDNVLLDVESARTLLETEGVATEARRELGPYELPVGLFALVGCKRS